MKVVSVLEVRKNSFGARPSGHSPIHVISHGFSFYFCLIHICIQPFGYSKII